MLKTRSKKLTLKDVAQRLNVSTATISNAFNRPDQLSEQLRERILSECRKLGYLGPNAAARSLRTGHSGIVGIILAEHLSYSFTDPVASQFLQGIAEVFDECRCNMLLLPSHERFYQGQVSESMVDGFIVYGPPREQSVFERLLSQQKPLIAVDFDMDGYVSVNVDNYAGARASAAHALAHSSGPVAILGLRLIDSDRVCRIREDELFDATSSIAIRRLRGYQAAAEAAERPIPAELIWNVPASTHDKGYQAAREALMCSPRPQLLLCMSDRIALAAIQAARHLGLKVPEDVQIVGFDDIPEASTHHPSLTTVHQQSVEKGRIAADIFLQRREARNVMLPTRLVIRESCP